MRTLLLLCLFALCLTPRLSAQRPKTESTVKHTADTTDTVKQMLADRKAVLLDVREPAEWKEGHLKDAKSLPLSEIKEAKDLKVLLKDVPKGSVVYLHCGAGLRCLKAAEMLKDTGYDLRPLKQGFDELTKAGFPEAK